MKNRLAFFGILSLGFVLAAIVWSPSLNPFKQGPNAAAAAQPGAQESVTTATQPSVEDLSYLGNRAEHFAKKFPKKRPDTDWRDVLSPLLRDADPKYSHGFEEVLIRDHFQDKEKGFYLDVGCADPELHSTTNYLETVLQWKGIGIDVNSRFAPLWKEKRPNSKFICRAIFDTDGEVLTLYIGGYIRSLDRKLTEAFVRRPENIRTVDVTTITLNTLLEENGIDKIDFLSMDIEGAEMGALRGFDIQKYRPDLCCVETNDVKTVTDYFDSRGYELIQKYRKADKINVYYRPKLPSETAD